MMDWSGGDQELTQLCGKSASGYRIHCIAVRPDPTIVVEIFPCVTRWRTEMAWRNLYAAALMETDDDKMSRRIAEAEGAIVARQRELFKASCDNIHEEEEAMDDALYALNALKSCLPIRPESRSHAESFYQPPAHAAVDNAHNTTA